LQPYDFDLSHFNRPIVTLTTNSQTLDFVILEWVDSKQDGQFDIGDDSREVDVKVVTPWTAVGTWTAGHAAMVQANADGASLAQLALDITGNAADVSALGNVGIITKGKQVDVTPLLDKLETDVRNSVYLAARTAALGQNFRAAFAYFGAPDNLYNYSTDVMKAAQINGLFGVTGYAGPPAGYTPLYTCVGMCDLMYARALIWGGNLTDAQYDALNIVVSSIQTKYCTPLTGSPLASLVPGDWVRFWNSTACEKPQWGAENLILTSQQGGGKTGDNVYFGWPLGFGSGDWWMDELASMCPMFSLRTNPVRGYEQNSPNAWFLNIPMLGQMIFNVRAAGT
jgi:hypothetical protein